MEIKLVVVDGNIYNNGKPVDINNLNAHIRGWILDDCCICENDHICEACELLNLGMHGMERWKDGVLHG